MKLSHVAQNLTMPQAILVVGIIFASSFVGVNLTKIYAQLPRSVDYFTLSKGGVEHRYSHHKNGYTRRLDDLVVE